MSISTDITGGSGGSTSQLLDLLANPDAYKAKLQAMEDATTEYKKYVEAVGVVTEIATIREQVKAAQTKADAETAEAKAYATSLVADAKKKATALVNAAQSKADALTAEAQALKDQAQADAVAADKALKQAVATQKQADSVAARAKAQALALQESQAAADAAVAAAEAAKADILAKHQEFIQGL